MVDQNRLTPEMLVPRMGEYLIHKGLISSENLRKALDYQQEAMQMDIHFAWAGADRPQGAGRAALDQAVTEQIIQLRSACRLLTGRWSAVENAQRSCKRLSARFRIKQLKQISSRTFRMNCGLRSRTSRGTLNCLSRNRWGRSQMNSAMPAGQPAIHRQAGSTDRGSDPVLAGSRRAQHPARKCGSAPLGESFHQGLCIQSRGSRREPECDYR